MAKVINLRAYKAKSDIRLLESTRQFMNQHLPHVKVTEHELEVIGKIIRTIIIRGYLVRGIK